MTMKGILKTWTVEFIASLLFSFAYFILLGRTQSAEFSLNVLELSALISFIYVISVFVSSYHFEADLFPFYSILRALFSKTWTPLWLNIPGQLLGTVAGLAIYIIFKETLLTLSPLADVEPITVFEISDVPMRSLIMAVLVFILVYSMIIVRKLFLLKGMTGTIVIAILIFVLAALTVPVEQVSIVTWWQDTILNIYHTMIDPQREIDFGWPVFLTAAVVIGTIFLANLKANQYNRPRSDQYEEPGEYTPQFSKDYDI